MILEIRRLIWLEDIVDKLFWKHNVVEAEVVEVLRNRPVFIFKETGFTDNEDVYAAFGQTDSNRLLSIFFVYTIDKCAIIVSARDMSQKERSKHGR